MLLRSCGNRELFAIGKEKQKWKVVLAIKVGGK